MSHYLCVKLDEQSPIAEHESLITMSFSAGSGEAADWGEIWVSE